MSMESYTLFQLVSRLQPSPLHQFCTEGFNGEQKAIWPSTVKLKHFIRHLREPVRRKQDHILHSEPSEWLVTKTLSVIRNGDGVATPPADNPEPSMDHQSNSGNGKLLQCLTQQARQFKIARGFVSTMGHHLSLRLVVTRC